MPENKSPRNITPDGPPPNPDPRKAAITLPPGSCDAHCHIYGPFSRFPLPEDRSFTPNEAPETELRRLHEHFGFDRAVIVQSQGHGFDHQPVRDALAVGGGRYRGVALVQPGTSAEEVASLDAAGFCGVRFSFMAHLGGYSDLSRVRSVIDRVRPHDWHIAIHVAGQGIVEMADFIRSIKARVVIDHMARPALADGPEGAAVTELRRLLDTGKVWVKLSGADRLSKDGAPYRDAIPIARSLADHAPERILWGSDWPHVNLHGPMSDDASLVDLIAEIAPSETTRRRLLVDNPAEFFRFQ
jgi:2-pyrone-4,6-dicarboxylate lactonase